MSANSKNSDRANPNEMLTGTRVLSFAHYLQGPSGVQMLADLGADVIKVEPPKGNFERHWSGGNLRRHGESVFFLCANRNQRSLCVDLKDPAGVQVIRDLLPQMDVFVENFRPGVMAKLGLGYETVKAINPRIIYVSCSGYGSDGPYKDRPGQDMLIQSLSGLAGVSGPGTGAPVPTGAAIVDQHGAVLLAMGVLASLVRRAVSGSGCKVEVNLLNAALDLQMEALTYFLNSEIIPARSKTGIASWFHPAPYGVYATADGFIALSLNTVELMSKALECEELKKFIDADNYQEREAISAMVGREVRKKSTSHWMEVFARTGVWHAPVNEYPDLLKDPQIAHNGVFMDVKDRQNKPIRLVAHPVRYDGQAPKMRMSPPALGQHTQAILQELGYARGQIDTLLKAGIVKQSTE